MPSVAVPAASKRRGGNTSRLQRRYQCRLLAEQMLQYQPLAEEM
jgi:hypothetical protein